MYRTGCTDSPRRGQHITTPDMNLRQTLLVQELKYRPGPAPWTTTLAGTGISERTRRVLINWMTEVVWSHDGEKCVLFYAVNYVDRFLCKRGISRPKLQTLGGAALLVASKFCEAHCFTEDQMAEASATTKDAIVRMEAVLLRTLEFGLACVTVLEFLAERLGKDGFLPRRDGKICRTAVYLAVASLLSYQFQSDFRPSQIAQAIIFLCRGAPARERWSWAAVCMAVWDTYVCSKGKSWLDTTQLIRSESPPFYYNPWVGACFMV